MKKFILFLTFCLAMASLMPSCSSSVTTPTPTTGVPTFTPVPTPSPTYSPTLSPTPSLLPDTDNTYEQITQEMAKQLMDSGESLIILDVRTKQEYDMGHIKNAILIPDYEITQRAEKELPDKNALILVYCRSGNRSKTASQALADLGYTNVKEFGGIITWEYGTVK